MDPDTLRDRFKALGPWYTRYEIDGIAVGGDNSYEHDDRVEMFFEWLGSPRTILELGSLEGAHTMQLAERDFVDRVVGLEGRLENVARARLACDLLGRGNIELAHVDLDDESLRLEQFGTFDAVFCAGLLYHLTTPWRLIEKIGRVTGKLFLDTHVSERGDMTTNGWRGSYWKEGGYADPLSGLSNTSFWMSLPSLREVLSYSGFQIAHEHLIADWAGFGPRVHLAAVKP